MTTSTIASRVVGPEPAAHPRWAVPLEVLFAVLAALLVATIMVLAVMAGDLPRLFATPLQAVFPVTGLVILRSRPRNTVGWAFLVAGLLLAISAVGDAGLLVARDRQWSSAVVHVLGWCDSFAWFPGLFTLITVALLHFPDGAPVSPRWRWLSVTAVVLMTTYAVCFSIAIWDAPVASFYSDDVPHASGVRGVLLLIGIACLPGMVPVVLGTVASLVVRWRRSTSIERLQLRWVAAAGTLAVLIEIMLFLVHVGDTAQTVIESTVFGLIAVATGIAITRHGLYEIDRIVSRAVSYLLISALLVGVYVGVVAAAGLVIPDRYGSIGVAVATLAAVALFVPLRARIQRVVDRRFDRARYDADQLVTAFSGALRADLTQAGLHDELLRAVRRAVAPSSASVWIAPRSGDRTDIRLG